MKFEFSFQKVLDFKEKEKEIAKQEYGMIKHHQLQLEEQIEELNVTKEQVFNLYNDVHQKSVAELLELQQEIDHVNFQKKRLEHQSFIIDQEVEQKHLMLIERSKEAKIWNQWKTKSKAAFQKQLDQKEQAFFDEMAVLRYTRKI